MLDQTIDVGSMSKITVEEVYINQKLPFPKTMKIKDIPRFRMFADAYY